MDFVHEALAGRFDEADIMKHKNRAKEEYEENPLGLHYKKTEEISELIGIPINKNERKWRTRREYFDELHEGQSVKKEVLAWFKANPKGTQIRCSQELGISRKTVSKWWPARKKKKTPRVEPNIKNPCPICGAEMSKTKVGPHFWEQKSKFYARIDKDCPNCGHHIQGKSYPCQR